MKEREGGKQVWLVSREGVCYLVKQDQLHIHADRQ